MYLFYRANPSFVITSALLLFIMKLLVDVDSISQIHMKKGAPHTKLANGILQGTVGLSRDGKPFYSFLGLRYANQPQRFQDPELLTGTWKSVKPAHAPGNKCPQIPYRLEEPYVGDEDCLFLNVHIPMKDYQNPLPVMFWIHGGSFHTGEGHGYKPDFFMDEDVILITVNYRLGPLGFLSTGDEAVPGNMGLKDVVVALKWVQQNIAAFGGNKNQVTIFGESAGSIATHYLILSPLAKGLFHSAIALSGTADTPSTFQAQENSLSATKALAEIVSCPTTTTNEMIECFKRKDAKELIEGTEKMTKWSRDPLVKFTPTVDPASSQPFLLAGPGSRSSHHSKVPFILGANKDEGLLISALAVVNDSKLLADLNQKWNEIAPLTFGYENLFPTEHLITVSQKIKNFYFGNQEICQGTLQNLTNLYSDTYFLYPTQFTSLQLSKSMPVYLYLFSYQGEYSLTMMGGNTEIFGVTHADDLQYYLPNPYSPKLSPASEEFSKRLVKLWVSFATTGEPKATWGKAKWNRISPEQANRKKPITWYDINNDTNVLQEPFKLRLQFWEQLLQDYTKKDSFKDEL